MPLLPASESDRIRRFQSRYIFSSYAIAKQVAQDTNAFPPKIAGGSDSSNQQSLYIPIKLGPAFLSGEELSQILRANSTLGTSIPQPEPEPTVYASANWATYFKGVTNALLQNMKVDSDGNIYVSGNYNSSSAVSLFNADGDSQTVSSVTLPSTSGADAFLIKYNSTGQVQWAVNLQSGGTDTSWALAIDSSNNIYFGGAYSSGGTTPFVKNVSGNTQTNSSIQLPTTTNREIFLIKYNSNGIAQWAANMAGTQSIEGYGLVTDSTNNVYLVGNVSSSGGSATITNGASTGIPLNSSVTLPTLATYAAFLVKWDTTGSVQWATYLNGIGGNDIGNSVAVDSSNNIYFTGNYVSSSTAEIYNASGNTQTLSSVTLPANSSIASIFLIKYNSSGVAQWATYIQGSGVSSGNGIVVNSSDSITIVGTYTASSDITLKNVSGNTQTDSALILPSVTGSQMLIVQYSSSGTCLWATYINTDNTSEGRGIAIDSSDNLYITGGYKSSTTVSLMDTTDASGGPQQLVSSITLPAIVAGTSFLISYTSAGVSRWATYLDSDDNYDLGYAVQISNSTITWAGYYKTNTSDVIIQNAAGTSQAATSIRIPSSGLTNASFIVQLAI